MSGAQTSAWGDPNVLLQTLSGAQNANVQNTLMQVQQRQQDVAANNTEVVARAASTLLDPSLYPTEEARAAAWPGIIQQLKANGYAPNAPETYPGEEHLKATAQLGISTMDRYKLGLTTPPGTQAAIDAALRPASTTGAAGGSTAAAPATGGDGLTGDKAHDLPLIAQRESGGNPTVLNYVAQQDPTAYQRGATASGKYQIVNSTWRDGMQLAGLDPAQYATARDAPEAVQDKVASALYDKYGAKPWQKGPQDWVKDEQGRYQMATVRPSAGGAAGGAPSAPSPGGPGGPATPAPYQEASNVPQPPPASTGAPGGDLVGPRVLPPIGPGSPVVTPQSMANTPAPPQAQVPQPPANRVMPGAADGPPAAAQPPPAARSALPRAADLQTGVNSQQYRDAADLQRRALILEAQVDPTGRLKQLATGLRQQAQLLLQTDSVVQTQEGQVHPLTGKIDDPAKPLADYHETSPGSGIWVGGPGTEPRFQPPGRLIIDKAGDVWRTTTGGAEKLSRLDPAAVGALNEAAAAGTATGTAVAKQLPDLMATARNAQAQEGQIDYATNQLREAAKGNIPSGYFSPALATAAAAAKSLGLDQVLRNVGVDPAAVGNVQTAQKTLSVIGGAILRQALGPGSAITEGKIEQFIHTQPGIETDPKALERIMAWARSQYTYERELGTAAVTEAAKQENAGRLPPHWLPSYYRDHGFAPIYDPGTQEMVQPDGQAPPRVTPPPATRPPLSSFRK